MSRLSATILICCLASILLAQTGIRKVQYYWNDGSWGNSTQVMLSGTGLIDEPLELDLDEAVDGVNFLHIRVINADGVPGIPVHYTFRKIPNLPLSPVTAIEYFWDEDPGEGNGTAIAFTQGTDVDVSSSVILPDNTAGVQFMGIRAQSALGKWSFPFWKQIYNVYSPDMDEVAGIGWYFTGTGAAADEFSQELQNGPGHLVEEIVTIPLDQLAEGQSYLLHVYALSSEGARGHELLLPFTPDFKPRHPVLSYSQGMILLSWDPVPGADQYQVYESSAPEGPFLQIASPEEENYTEPAIPKRFYTVKAVSETAD